MRSCVEYDVKHIESYILRSHQTFLQIIQLDGKTFTRIATSPSLTLLGPFVEFISQQLCEELFHSVRHSARGAINAKLLRIIKNNKQCLGSLTIHLTLDVPNVSLNYFFYHFLFRFDTMRY